MKTTVELGDKDGVYARVWAQFAAAALTPLIAQDVPPAEAASFAATYADALFLEWENRK
jgi:hypothetical protein